MAFTVTAPQGPTLTGASTAVITGASPFQFTANARYYCVVLTQMASGTAPAVSDVSQGTLNWAAVGESQTFGSRRLTVLQGTGTLAPTSTVGQITLSSAADNTAAFFSELLACDGVFTPAGDSVESDTSLTLAVDFDRAENGVLAWWAVEGTGAGAITAGAGFSEAHEMHGAAAGSIELAWADTEPAAVTMTYASGGSAGVGIELVPLRASTRTLRGTHHNVYVLEAQNDG